VRACVHAPGDCAACEDSSTHYRADAADSVGDHHCLAQWLLTAVLPRCGLVCTVHDLVSAAATRTRARTRQRQSVHSPDVIDGAAQRLAVGEERQSHASILPCAGYHQLDVVAVGAVR
jgi:hypothetical protein